MRLSLSTGVPAALTLMLAGLLAGFAPQPLPKEGGLGYADAAAGDPPHGARGRAGAAHAGRTPGHPGAAHAGRGPGHAGVRSPSPAHRRFPPPPARMGAAPPAGRAPVWGGRYPPYARAGPPPGQRPAAAAPRWREGHWWRGSHQGRFGAWWVVGPSWFWFPAEIYPYPEPYAYPYSALAPYTEPYFDPGYWYWCDAYQQYYPYVGDCPSGWIPVPPE
jgi:hypothetical protein